jgi:hypothetical protein
MEGQELKGLHGLQQNNRQQFLIYYQIFSHLNQYQAFSAVSHEATEFGKGPSAVPLVKVLSNT